MSDRAIEAIAAVIRDLGHDPKADAGRAWAAGVEAVIAHAPCGGTNYVKTGKLISVEGQGHLPQSVECSGPHTVIDKGDGTNLYADTHLVGTYMGREKMVLVPLPSDWRIE
jgi:hypothetical protein